MNKIDEIALRIAEQIEPRGRTYSPDHYKDVVKLVFAELSNDAAPVAICDTKNRIKWDGDDDAHRYSSAPNCIEVGTTLFTHPAPVIASEQKPVDVVPPAWTNLIEYVLQDDLHNRLTPRVVDIAYTAFMLAKQPNSEDGGNSDWFNDTKPSVMEAIAKLRKDLVEFTRPPNTADIEQRVAEACAKVAVEYMEYELGHQLSKGKWREYM